MIALVVVAVVVVLLVAAAPLLDRLAAERAEHAASEFLTDPFGGPAVLRVRDRPFLTQAVRGVYRNIEVGGELQLGQLRGATLAAHLTNVHLPLRELLGGRTREVACERVQGRVVIPYEEIARVATIPGLSLRFSGETLRASAAVPVPGLNQIVRVRGDAVLTYAGSGTVWLRVDGVSVVGVTVPSILWNQILPVLNVPITLPTLPYGLRIDSLRPTAAGLVADGSADAVVFTRQSGDEAASRDVG